MYVREVTCAARACRLLPFPVPFQQQLQLQQHRSLTDSLGFEMVTGNFLHGKVFLVTGSTSGIGRHTADLLALHGGTVIIHGRSLSRVKRCVYDAIGRAFQRL